MPQRPPKDLKRGGQVDSAEFNRIMEAQRATNYLTSSGDIQYRVDGAGMRVWNTPNPWARGLFAKITGAPTGAAHPWSQVYDDGTGVWTIDPDGWSGTATDLPAYELNGSTKTRTGEIVWLWFSWVESSFLFCGCDEAGGGGNTSPGLVSVNLATAAPLPAYTVSGGAGSPYVLTANVNAVWTIDGVSISVGQRILVKNESGTNGYANRIYVVTQAGTAGQPTIVTEDYDGNPIKSLLDGTRIEVLDGATNGRDSYSLGAQIDSGVAGSPADLVQVGEATLLRDPVGTQSGTGATLTIAGITLEPNDLLVVTLGAKPTAATTMTWKFAGVEFLGAAASVYNMVAGTYLWVNNTRVTTTTSGSILLEFSGAMAAACAASVIRVPAGSHGEYAGEGSWGTATSTTPSSGAFSTLGRNRLIMSAVVTNLAGEGTWSNSFTDGQHASADAGGGNSVVLCEGFRVVEETGSFTAAKTLLPNIFWICSGYAFRQANSLSGPSSSTDNAFSRWDGTTGDRLQDSGVICSDANAVSGMASLTMNTAGGVRTATANTNTLLLQAYNTGGAAYTTFATLTAGASPTCTLANVTSSTNFTPTTDDGGALGTSALQWSDVSLASGAVIGWAAAAMTWTHSAGVLTLAGGNLALGANTLTLTGSIAATGARVTKGWFTDLEATNAPTVSGAAVYYSGGTDVAIADGGTGASTATAAFNALSPLTTAGDVIYHDGANNIRLGIGAANRIMASTGSAPTWISTVGILDGTQAAVVPNAYAIGGLVQMHRFTIADGASANTDVVLTYKSRVIDATVIKTAAAGGAADTITVQNGANAITDAMSINVADKVIVRPGTIDDANWEIAAGGTLRISMVKSSAANTACEVVVTVIKVA